MFSVRTPKTAREERALRGNLMREKRRWRSPFLGVMQVNPRLNVLAIPKTRSLLRCLQIGAGIVAPSTFGKKPIPDRDFLFGGPAATFETPFENFLIRSTFQCSFHKVIIIYAQKSYATGVEHRRIFIDTGKIVRRQFTSSF